MQKKYTAMVRKSKLEYVAVCLELNVSARGVELAAVEKNLPSAIELYLQDIVENKLPGAIISEPKINIEYGVMDSRVLCNISLRGANILSGWRFELIQLNERSVYKPRLNYNFLPEDCIFRSKMVLRSGFSLSSFGSLTIFVLVADPLRSGCRPSSFGVYSFFFSGI
jgi:predicted RNase H-like HicB family nuclease